MTNQSYSFRTSNGSTTPTMMSTTITTTTAHVVGIGNDERVVKGIGSHRQKKFLEWTKVYLI